MFINTLCCFLLLLASGCKTNPGSVASFTAAREVAADTLPAFPNFKTVQKKYKTLLPIQNGLFITYDSFDYKTYVQRIESYFPRVKGAKDSQHLNLPFYGSAMAEPRALKWGVIDSAGKIVVPFICDAVRQLDSTRGVLSVYQSSYSLNTGLPRYRYSGICYFFDKQGITAEKGVPFSITTIFVADFHRHEFVIENGNTFYFPAPYYLPDKKSRGSVGAY